MGYFGIPFRNGVPIGLGSIVGFGAPQEFSPSELFLGGTVAGAWYDPSDLSTLFTTSAGTTQCAMPGQGSAVSVGLMLDKSQNGVGTNGAKRVNLVEYSEQFDNAYWSKSNSSAISQNTSVAPNGTTTADTASAVTTGTFRAIRRSPAVLTINTQFVWSVSAKAGTSSWLNLRFWDSGASGINAWFDLAAGTIGTVQAGCTASISSQGNGWYRCSVTRTIGGSIAFNEIDIGITDGDNTYTATAGASIIIWGADLRLASEASTLPLYQRIDANWYSTMAGNHAIAFNDTTARPELRARVNLLRWSEVFDATASGSAWINSGVTVTDGVLAPNGTNTADTITGTTGAYPHVRQAITLPAAGTYKASCYFQKTSGATRFPALEVFFAPGNAMVVLNTDTGVAANAQGTPTNISVSDAGGYWLVSFDVAVNITSATFYIYPASSSNGTSIAPNLTGSCVAWGADLRPANIGANVPAYQRIADANTYDTSGFPLYLRFDGIDDSMYTPANLNLSGTDKVAVFAGVRKTTAPTSEISVEFGAVGTLNGSFYNYWTALKAYFASVGTAFAQAETPALSYPISLVQTSIGNISQPLAALRINGTQYNSTASQGTGNYGNHSLYIGSRGNSSLWFNGHLYSLAVVGSAVSGGNIAAMESWVAGKTGIAI